MNALTLEQFVGTVHGFNGFPSSKQNEVLIYFKTVLEGNESTTASEIDALRLKLDLNSSRTAQDLSKRARNKNGLPARFVKKKRGYALERTAREEIKRLIDARPSKQIVSTEIMRLLSGLRSELRKNYLEEVYGCFQSNFLRAAIVLSWCVAFDSFREWLYRNHLGPLNSTMAKWKKPIKILNLEDFEYLTERTVIDTAKEAGIVGKETNKILVSLLDRRNSYAHPTGRTISISAAETYIEEVINEVVKKFP